MTDDVQLRTCDSLGPAAVDQVTAVVVTYNSGRHLAGLARALGSGTLAPPRILAVDNASIDDTVACARAAGFEIIERDSNDGFGAGCNTGLLAASTEFVLFCNPDVQPSRSALERLVAALASTPNAAVAGAALGEPVQARRFSRISASLVGFLPGPIQDRAQRFRRDLPVDQDEEQVVVDYVEGAFMLCRVTALRSVDGFDTRFFLYCEEEDLSRRLGERGWHTLLVPSARVAHQQSSSSVGVDGAAMAPFRVHSLYWYYRRYHSRMYAECARCMIAALVTLDRVYRVFAHRSQVYGRGTALAAFRSIDSVRSNHQRWADA
jgi:N-acetylglucosaminyl-diphospho-decaprenol L-rhamnosyltransferase